MITRLANVHIDKSSILSSESCYLVSYHSYRYISKNLLGITLLNSHKMLPDISSEFKGLIFEPDW